MMRRPEGHTLYWVYVWSADERDYNFDTSEFLKEARAIARAFIGEGWHHGHIYFGNEGGAFTDLDFVEQFKATT